MTDSSIFKQGMEYLRKAREESGVNIGGKMYSMVKDRVELFRLLHGSEYGIDTTLVHANLEGSNPCVIMSATIRGHDGLVHASGHAMERIDQSDKISYYACVQAAETNAVGRALAVFGLHGGEFASDTEIRRVDSHVESASAPPAEPVAMADTPTKRPPQGQSVPPPPPEAKYGQPEEADLDATYTAIINMLDTIDSQTDLARYWGELEPTLTSIMDVSRETFQSIKAAFQSRNIELAPEAEDEGDYDDATEEDE